MLLVILTASGGGTRNLPEMLCTLFGRCAYSSNGIGQAAMANVACAISNGFLRASRLAEQKMRAEWKN